MRTALAVGTVSRRADRSRRRHPPGHRAVGRGVRTLKGELYPEIALSWRLVFSIYLVWTTDRLNTNEISVAVICMLFGAFLTRMTAIHFNLKSPLF